MKEISVQIVTWRRQEKLMALVESLENQSIDKRLYEICICDSFSNDGTEDAVAALMAKYGNIQYFNISTNTLSAKRNFLIKINELPFIISLDDDLIVDRNFINAHYEAQKKTKRSVLCGQTRFPKEWIELSNYYRFRDRNHITKGLSKLNLEDLPPKNIVAMNMSFKKDEVENIGYMDEDFVNYGGEDVEFGYRLKKNNFKIVYLDDALAYHYENSNLEGYLHKLYISSRYSSKMLLMKAPDVFADAKSGLLRPIMENDSKLDKLRKRVINLVLNKHLNRLIITYLKAVDRIYLLYSPVLYNYICAYSLMKGIVEQNNSDLKEDWL